MNNNTHLPIYSWFRLLPADNGNNPIEIARNCLQYHLSPQDANHIITIEFIPMRTDGLVGLTASVSSNIIEPGTISISYSYIINV